jgi:hypothetical protein
MGTSSAWTPERRAKQSEIIRQTKPWLKSTGPTTARGKRRSAHNRFDMLLKIINVHEANRLFLADPEQWITIRRTGKPTVKVRKKGWGAHTLRRFEIARQVLNRLEMDRLVERGLDYGVPFSGVFPPREERTEQEFEDGANGWTAARRARQSNAIHRWQPWTRSTGPRTPEGRERAARRGPPV